MSESQTASQAAGSVHHPMLAFTPKAVDHILVQEYVMEAALFSFRRRISSGDI